MRTFFISIIVAILVSAPLAHAQRPSLQELRLQQPPAQKSKAGNNHELGIRTGEKDFLLPGEGFVTGPPVTVKGSTSKYVSSTGASSAFPVESVVQYKSFTFGTTSTLTSFSGKYVNYLIPQASIGAAGLSRDEIRELVDLTDVLYAHMMEVVGGEASGDGLLTIALLNPGYDFGGRGWVGKKGVELYQGYALRYRKDLLAGCVPGPVVHEMAHNFDIYNSYISHDGNNYHAWTSFLIPYAQHYTQAGSSLDGQVVNPRQLLTQSVDVNLDPWDAAGSSVTWADCIKTGNGCSDKEINANVTWGGIVLRYAALHGPDALKQAFRFVGSYKGSNSTPPSTAEAKNDLLVSAFAAGAQADVSCELKIWNWPVSASTANQMRIEYPNQNGFCADVDNDSHSAARGDHDDFNAAIRPNNTETVNGLDDDCDSIIDDVVLNEVEDVPADPYSARQVTIPSHITGKTTTTSDVDSYRIEIDTPRSINILGKGVGKYFTGWFEVRFASDPETTEPIYLMSGFAGGTVVRFDRAGTWIVTVMPWAGAGEIYEIVVSEVDPMPVPEIQATGSLKSGTVLVNVTSDKRSYNSEPTKVRLWAEGLGVVAEQQFEPTTIFKLKLPTNTNVRFRAQLLNGNSPLSGVTRSIPVGSQERTGTQIVISNSDNNPPEIPSGVNASATNKFESPAGITADSDSKASLPAGSIMHASCEIPACLICSLSKLRHWKKRHGGISKTRLARRKPVESRKL